LRLRRTDDRLLSIVATTSIEDAIAARGAPVWFQLYPTEKWEVAEAVAKRAERAGSTVIVVTLSRTQAPASCVSATMRSFSSRPQRRRRLRRVFLSLPS
jgi:isopentenyl diphosphate isomerase/L-lactate dehydrogenase-like FMN-dependent dehydrogenase